MGAYVDLKGGGGYLGFYESLNVPFKSAAERMADAAIDSSFAEYNRAIWSPRSAPVEVQHIAELLASAQYIVANTAGANPHAQAAPSVVEYRELAKKLTAKAIARGYLTSPDGQKITPADGQKSLSVKLSR